MTVLRNARTLFASIISKTKNKQINKNGKNKHVIHRPSSFINAIKKLSGLAKDNYILQNLSNLKDSYFSYSLCHALIKALKRKTSLSELTRST